ncbi:MAG TPA: hypothetical protein VFN51_01290 [Candidatus Saccharimonadales bacterium]|nr:hypothetical protein [Candidatus Saccharimonadales bacterium]
MVLMSEAKVGEQKIYGYWHGVITEVHADEGWFQFREIEAHAVDDERYGQELDHSQTARELFIDGIEHFFPVDGAELDELICTDPSNIQPGRLVTCFSLSEVISVPDIDDPTVDMPYRRHSREIWLGHQATTGNVIDFLETKARAILEK